MDYRAVRHDPTRQNDAVGQGDDAYSDVVFRVLHTSSTLFFVCTNPLPLMAINHLGIHKIGWQVLQNLQPVNSTL